MADAAHTPYDAVFYPGLAYDYTHPDRLATIASLNGLESAPAPRCRVLELGCGAGSNLIPMAFQYPESGFVGIDLSNSAVAKGVGEIADLGLKNIALRAADIMDVDASYGAFDYIIAHGVYSWVPAPVREKVLAIFRDNLTPQGVAYVSYNSYPGSHLRNLTRDIMHHHVHGIEDARERVAQARGILKFVAEASAKDTVYGAVLRDQFERVQKMRDEVLFHDDLLEGGASFLLREVVGAAGHHGLQYLSDATFARSDWQHHSEDVRAVLDRLCDDIAERHQYLDFIEGHGFRRTLLCRADIALERSPDPERIKRYRLAAAAKPVDPGVDPAAEGIASFRAPTGATLSTDHRLSKAALLHLGECWPRQVGFAELLEGAVRRLGPVAASLNLAEEEQALTGLLLRAANGGHIAIHLYPPQLTVHVSERPQASLLARKQVMISPVVTNQHHRTVLLEGEIVRRFLPLVDGTRTVDNLVTDLRQALAEAEPGPDGPETPVEPVSRESVEKNLHLLAQMALLVA